MERVLSALNKAVNSNAVINSLLAGIFGALAVRSFAQQRVVETLEEEKDSLLKANKVIKNTTWEWKQKLFAEAEANPHNALVPLSKLKAIYGEADAVPAVSGEDDKEEGPAPRIMI